MKEPSLPKIRCTEELRKAVEVAAGKENRTVTNWMLNVIQIKLVEEKKMKDYGTVTYKGKTYILTAQADFTGRADLEQYEDNSFELSASAVDNKGKEYIVYWIFVDDKENLDEYDYNKVDRVEEQK